MNIYLHIFDRLVLMKCKADSRFLRLKFRLVLCIVHRLKGEWMKHEKHSLDLKVTQEMVQLLKQTHETSI